MPLNLLKVNDDCLVEIFKYFTLFELADVASTCTRFRTIAREVFSLRHKSKLWKIFGDFVANESDPEYLRERRQTFAILLHFGDLLTKVEAYFYSEWHEKKIHSCNNDFFKLIVKHCTGTLETLELIYNEGLRRDGIAVAKQLFRNVKVLNVNCSPGIKGSFLSDAKQLTRLDLLNDSSDQLIRFLSNDYPELQSVKIAITKDMKRKPTNIGHYLKRHPNLTEVELLDGKFDIKSIGECQSLTKLSISKCQGMDISAISQLDKLTSLSLTIYPSQYSLIESLKTSKSANSLEQIWINGYYQDEREHLPSLVRFTNLKDLLVSFQDAIDDELLARLRCLNQLRVLTICGFFGSITSDALLKLVESLPHLEQLNLRGNHHFYGKRQWVELLGSTYLLICQIYRHRNQKLVIRNFDLRDEYYTKQPFARWNKSEFVQHFVVSHGNDNYEYIETVKI